jgi:DNA polymerase-3 subunit delta
VKLRPAELDRLPPAGPKTPLAVLFYGEDSAQIAQRREALARHWGGAEAEADMRLDRLTAAQLRSDPAALDAALRARGFFPGPRVVILTEATDGLADAVLTTAAEATGPDARLIVTAGSLTPRSSLRKGFETGARIAAVPCYRGALDDGELTGLLHAHGLGQAAADARGELLRISGDIDRLSFDQLLRKLALWQHGETTGPNLDDVLACAPPGEIADTDDLMLAVLRRDPAALRQALARLREDGVTLAIALGRQARQLLEARVAMEAEGQGAEAALGRTTPPVPFARRRAFAAVLGRWKRSDLEALLTAIHEVDTALRSAGARDGPPGVALLERAMLRFALRPVR